jgi:uncharacterized protein YqgC (DUF456 family)
MQSLLYWGGVTLAGLLCVAGVAVSCLSLSGTWFVVLASGILALLSGPEFPGIRTVAIFAVLSGIAEVAELAAGSYGIKKRGGSNLAGFAAFVGGMAGLVLGMAIPIPLIGPLVGMLAGSFLLAFLVERHRLKKSAEAVDIATGAVMGRIVILLLKTALSIGMSVYLAVGMLV